MKSLILFSLFFGSAFAATAQNVHIPDANFKAYLIANEAINTNGDKEIQTKEAAAFTGKINCSRKEISDLTGIEAFKKLTNLDCSYNQLSALDLSRNMALTNLSCINNQLSVLDVSQNTALTNLRCGNNLLSALDLSKNTALTWLSCWNNQLTALDVSKNTILVGLDCGKNQLSHLDISKNTALMGFDCSKNQLSILDISQNTALMNLSCVDNPKLTCVKIAEAQNKKLYQPEIPTTAKFSTSCD